MQTLRSVFVSGSVASAITATSLALLAKSERKGALRPINATSHWTQGEEAGNCTAADVSHTLVGYATHHASVTLCTLPFQIWLAMHPPRSQLGLARDATIMSGIAAVFDYQLAPKRFTPGWEKVLSKESQIAAYGALAIGLIAGARIADAFLVRRQMR